MEKVGGLRGFLLFMNYQLHLLWVSPDLSTLVYENDDIDFVVGGGVFLGWFGSINAVLQRKVNLGVQDVSNRYFETS